MMGRFTRGSLRASRTISGLRDGKWLHFRDFTALTHQAFARSVD